MGLSYEDMIDRPMAEPIHYMQMMGSASHTYGNAIAYIQRWLEDLFPAGLFKTFHVNSKIAHRQIRSTPQELFKKQKPMMILRPRIDFDDERFLEGTPLIQKQTLQYSNFGVGNLQPFFSDSSKHLAIKYQLNRTVMNVDVILIFSTLMQQLNYANYIMNSVPIGIPFDLKTCFESYLSLPMMKVISDIARVPFIDEEEGTKPFLEYVNSHVNTPVTYKLQGSTQTHEFYRYYPVRIDTRINSLNTDDGEKVGHVMDNYQISFTIRMEFFTTGFYYLYASKSLLEDLPRMEIENDSVVIPVYTDVIFKKDLELDAGWEMFNRVTIGLEKENDEVDFNPFLNGTLRACIDYHLDKGIPMNELIKIKIRKQGRTILEGINFTVDYKERKIQFYNKEFGYYSYSIIICVNRLYINNLTKDLYNLK